jgi:UDP-GlcNAc:undecaprenyl-phosphate GlcNAc-1-phosphate transferase
MNNYIHQIFTLPLLISSVFAFVTTYLVKRVYERRRWLDDPKKQSHEKVIHTQAVPRGGGLAVFTSILLASLLFLPFDHHLIAIIAGGFVIMVIGVWDDIKNVNPYARLLLGFLAATLVVTAGINMPFITNPIQGGVFNFNSVDIPLVTRGVALNMSLVANIMAIIWIVWCMNMVNWSKGLDGQLPGIVVIAALVIAMLSFRFSQDVTQWKVSILAAIVAGSYLGFLPWNLYPQKMMPGYGGGALAGFFLAVLSILSGAKLATLIIVLAVPMIDAFYVMMRRIMSGKSPVWGDRSHFHHKLLDLGWSKRTVALFYWMVTLALGLFSLQLDSKQKLFTILMLPGIFGGILLWLKFLTSSLKRHDQGNGLKT